MSEISEQDDFESVVPPSIDGEDTAWDDDILPPPYISDDETSVVSEDHDPFISEPVDSLEEFLGPKPTKIVSNNVSMPSQVVAHLTPELTPTTSGSSEDLPPFNSASADSLDDILGPKSAPIVDEVVPPPVRSPLESEFATTTAPPSNSNPVSILDDDTFMPNLIDTVFVPEVATTESFEPEAATTTPLSDAKPAAIVDNDVPMSPQLSPRFTPEVATTVPLSNSAPVSILDDDAFMPNLGLSPEVATSSFEPGVATIAPLSDAKPAAILDNDISISPQFVPEVASTAPPSNSAPVSILDDDAFMPHLGNTTFLPEVAPSAPLADSKPAAIVDNDVSMHSPVHPHSKIPVDIPVAATAWPCNATYDVPAAVAVAEVLPSNPAPPPQFTENLYNTSTKQAYIPPEEDTWHPEPSAPFEPNDVDQSQSALSSILDALDPSERASFLEEQNKILENIERQASEERASAQKAWNMMAMEKDAALAEKLQEQERKSLQQRRHNSAKEPRKVVIKGSGMTDRAIQEGTSIVVECMRCHKAMYVPKATKAMYCPICRDITSFKKRTSASKKKPRGFFGRLGKSHKTKV